MRHKHYDCIVAWAEGKKIEILSDSTGQWEDLIGIPYWVNNFQFRIKPEPKPDVVQTCEVSISFESFTSGYPTVQFTFDGETGKLKSAEVI